MARKNESVIMRVNRLFIGASRLVDEELEGHVAPALIDELWTICELLPARAEKIRSGRVSLAELLDNPVARFEARLDSAERDLGEAYKQWKAHCLTQKGERIG